VLGEECIVYSDGYQYDPQADKWAPLPTPVDAEGHPLTLSGGTAVAWSNKEILAVGGVNRNIFLGGIQGLFPMPDYLKHEPKWYRFNPNVLIYSTITGQWRTLTQTPLTARAGASLVSLTDTIPAALLLGGELMPGIRSTDVTLISAKGEE
jgi:N-acetylneuraminic acid mutarotase